MNSEHLYTNYELYFANERCPRNDVRTGWTTWKLGPNEVHMTPKWTGSTSPNGGSASSWTGLIWPKWPKVEMRSSDQAFWRGFSSNFGWFWRPKLQQKMELASEVFFVSNWDGKLMDFDSKFEPSQDDTWAEVVKCAKSIFEQQSECFLGFWTSRKHFNPWFCKQKST